MLPRRFIYSCFLLFFLLPFPHLIYAQAGNDNLAYAHFARAKTLFSAAKADSAVSELLIAKSLFRKNDTLARLKMSKVLADFYFVNGLDSAAVPPYLELLQSPLVSDSTKAEIHSRLATVFFNRKDYSLAARNDSAALTIYSRYGLKIKLADAYLLLAMIRQAQSRFGEAEQILLRKCLPLYSYENGQKRGSCFIELARTYLLMQRTSEAKWFFIQANLVARKTGDKRAITESLIGLAKVKVKLKDFNLALNDLHEALKIAVGTTSYQQLASVNYCLYDLHRRMGNERMAKTAQNNYQRYIATYNEQNNKKVVAATKIKQLAEQEEIQVAKAKPTRHSPAKTISHLFLAIVIIASLAIGAILFLKFRRNKP